MPLACTMGRHAPISPAVRNQGLRFGRCRHCRRDVIRLRGGWVTPPHGLRVVWRKAAEDVDRGQAEPVSGPRGRRLSAVADLIGAGLQMAGWALAARWRAALRRRGPRAPDQPVRALTSG